MVTIDGFPALQFQVLDARRDTTVGGGDAQTSWRARLRYTAPTAATANDGNAQIQFIEFLVAGSELNSERHDRESHTAHSHGYMRRGRICAWARAEWREAIVTGVVIGQHDHLPKTVLEQNIEALRRTRHCSVTVSYTHLTLPTKA